MAIDTNKLQQLYSTLKNGGYTQSYDEFKRNFLGNDHYENRKQVYDLLTENGAEIGRSYGDFMRKIQAPRTPQPAQSSAAPAKPAYTTASSKPATASTQTRQEKPAVSRGALAPETDARTGLPKDMSLQLEKQPVKRHLVTETTQDDNGRWTYRPKQTGILNGKPLYEDVNTGQMVTDDDDDARADIEAIKKASPADDLLSGAARSAWEKADKVAENIFRESVNSPDMTTADINSPIKAQTAHLKAHDMEKMSDDAWNNLGSNGQQMLIDNNLADLRAQYPDADKDKLGQAAYQMARQQSDRSMYNEAVKQNAPENVISFFLDRAFNESSIGKLLQGTARYNAGSTGDMQARQEAEQEYGKEHPIANVSGQVASMAIDPLTYAGGGLGGAAVKGGTRLAARLAATKAGTRLAGKAATRRALSSTGGKLATGAVASGTNLATYNAGSELTEQARWGGEVTGVDPETGRYIIGPYSPKNIGKQALHGAVMGAATGIAGTLIGNVSNKAVQATRSTAGKAAERAAQLGVGTVAEGTIFAAPEVYETQKNYSKQVKDISDPKSENYIADTKERERVKDVLRRQRNGDMKEELESSIAMMLGFKVSGAIKATPKRIQQLFTTPYDRNGHIIKAGFETRLRAALDGSRPDLALTKDEKQELNNRGYNDLARLAEGAALSIERKKKKQQQEAAKTKDSNTSTFTGAEDTKEEDKPLPLQRFEKLMDDKKVSAAARAKMFYYLTGQIPSMPTVLSSGVETVYDRDNKPQYYVVKALGNGGEVITSRTFTSKQRAETEKMKIDRQGELNLIDLGEQARDNEAQSNIARRMDEEAEIMAAWLNSYEGTKVTKKELIKLFQKNPDELTGTEKARRNLLTLRIAIHAEEFVTSDQIREEVGNKYNVDVDNAIKKEPNRRSEQEQKAVEEYSERLSESIQREYDRQNTNNNDGNGPTPPPASGPTPPPADGGTAVVEPDMTATNENEPETPQSRRARLADEQTAQRREDLKPMQHVDDNGLHEATLKERDAQGNNKRVYIVGGKVNMTADGTAVDPQTSDESITVYDPETGEKKMISPTAANGILSLGHVTTAEEIEAQLQQERQEFIGNQADDTQPAYAPDMNHTPANGEVVYVEDGQGGYVRGTVDGYDENEQTYMVHTESPVNGRVNQPFRQEQLYYSREPEQEGRPKQEGTEGQPEQTEAQPEQQTADTEQPKVPEPQVPAEGETGTNGTNAMPMKADGKNPDFNKAGVERSHAFLYGEESGLDKTAADNFVQAHIDKAKKQLKDAQKKKNKVDPDDFSAYQEEESKIKQGIKQAQDDLDFWNNIKNAEADAQARAEKEARDAEAIKQEGPATSITEKWQNANKIEGDTDEIVLPNGERIKGHYVLHESGASSPSHNSQSWRPTEGFPTDENGNTVNDRDYENDRSAQQETERMGASFDQRALQSPVVVSQDGVVLSGNGRTMAGEIAARNGTDTAYIEYLQQHAQRYGFTPEQVGSMEHPRVSFVPDERMPYTAETFAKFNQRETKSQNKTEQAIKLGKTVSDEVYKRIAAVINGYETIAEFYNDAEASIGVIQELRRAGILTQADIAQMIDGARGNEKLSAIGRDFLENMLIGKAFDNDPDVIRMLTNQPSMRQKVVTALAEIANNVALGKDYSLQQELTDAIKLCYNARYAGYKEGDIVSPYARQGLLFAKPGELQTVADVNNVAMLMLADVINDKRVKNLKIVFSLYNKEAQGAAAGQTDMFNDGKVRTKQQILKDVINFYNEKYGRKQQLEAAERAEKEKQRREQGTPPAPPSDQSNQTGTEPKVDEQGTEPKQDEQGTEPEQDEQSAEPEQPKQGEGERPKQGEGERNEQDVEAGTEQTSTGYTITPTTYTTKRGKALNLYLVKFDHDLTDEEKAAAKELAKADKGWWSREHGGWLMRSEEAAQQLAETIAKEESAVADARPAAANEQPNEQPKSNDTTAALTKAQKDAAEFPYMGRMGTRYTASAIRTDAEGKRYTVQFEGETDANGNSRERRINLNETIPEGATMVIFSPNGVIPMGYASRNEATGKYTVWDMDGKLLIKDGERQQPAESNSGQKNNGGWDGNEYHDITDAEGKVVAAAKNAPDDEEYNSGVKLYKENPSIGVAELQRKLKIGYQKATLLHDRLQKEQPQQPAESAEEPNPVGKGPFGNIYDQFKGKAKEAIKFLMGKKEGEAVGALHHHKVGDISLVWGDSEAGLKKILAKHPEVVNNLQDIIDGMEIVSESDNRIKLESPTHFAVISKEYKGKPRDKWLLTAYEKKGSGASDGSMGIGSEPKGKQNGTAPLQNPSSTGKGNNSSANGKKDDKITDFGEKIGGSRKDEAQAALELLSKKTKKDIAKVKKADDILSKKLIEKMHDEGRMSHEAARALFAMNSITDMLGTKLKKAVDGGTLFGIIANTYADAVKKWSSNPDAFKLTSAEIAQTIEKYFREHCPADVDAQNIKYVAWAIKEWLPAIIDTYKEVGNEGRGRLSYVIREVSNKAGTKYFVMRVGRSRGYAFGTREAALTKLRELCPVKETKPAKGKDTKTGSTSHLRIVQSGNGLRIKSTRINGEIYLSGLFYNRPAAEAYLQEHAEELSKIEESYAALLGTANVLQVEREGLDYRNGHDVTPEEFQKQFGFRGVEFGNWVTQKERQPYLNTTYDALMDLASILGLSPKALSLGGRLGLSFGGRGRGGKFSAHYESDYEVINLTRTKGAGSLAHEWFHAVDNYLARSKSGNVSDFSTETRGFIDGMREELSKAFDDLVTTIKFSNYDDRSRRAGEYWHRTREEAARAFELYIEDKLEEKSGVSPMLTRRVDDPKSMATTDTEKKAAAEASSSWPYPTTEERKKINKAFDNLFNTIQEKTDPAGNVVLFHKTESAEAPLTKEQIAIRDGMAEHLNRTGLQIFADEQLGQRIVDNEEQRKGIREQRAYHGSGANFDNFDSSHMGEGEGAQAHGWGHYVAVETGTARGYAESARVIPDDEAWRSVQMDYEIDNDIATREAFGITEPIFIEFGYNIGDADTFGLLKEAAKYYGADIDTLYDKENEEPTEKGEELLETLFYDMDADFSERMEKSKTNFFGPFLYTVDIPDNTGKNYIEESKTVSKTDRARITDQLYHKLISENNEGLYDDATAKDELFKELKNDFEGSTNLTGRELYEKISSRLGSDEAASEFLHSIGYNGIHYYGRQDGECYVIFDDADVKITDKVRFFRSSAGEILGFTVGGKIYLDPRKATPETAFHEYGHIWLEALKQGNRKEYDSLMQKVKDDAKLTPIWEEVKKNYPGLSDEALTEEVFVMYSGRKGSRRIEERIRQIAAQRGMDITQKATTISALQQLKQAIQNAWRGILDFLHINYKNVDEAVEQQVKDFIMGNNPLDALARHQGRNTAEEPADIRFQFAGEKGARNLDTAEERTERMDNLSIAREMEAAKKDAKAIKLATGWERGADGLWRYEIPDAEEYEMIDREELFRRYNKKFDSLPEKERKRLMYYGMRVQYLTKRQKANYIALRNRLGLDFYYPGSDQDGIPSNPVTLPDVLKGKNAETLYKAYPELRDIKVEYVKSPLALRFGLLAKYNPDTNTITIYDDNYFKHRSHLLHEVQHAIQFIEGFAKGGNSDMFHELDADKVRYRAYRLREKVANERQAWQEIEQNTLEKIQQLRSQGNNEEAQRQQDALEQHRPTKEDIDRQEEELRRAEELNDIADQIDENGLNGQVRLKDGRLYESPFDAYQALAGEVEARNVERRNDMTEEERRQTLAKETEDVAPEDQIFLRGEGDNAERQADHPSDIIARTSGQIDAEYPNWLEGTTTGSGKHTTQVAGTRKTYGHVGDWIEKHLGKDVRILDASSGMGYGTKDLRERGFNIEDVEPYQSEERKRENPATYSSYDDVNGKYDYIISNAVLNVIPDDWRRDVLHDMADRLNEGGRLFINTRKAGEEKHIKDKIELDSPREVLVKRGGRIASYQRFFTPEELRDYVADELGNGYKVEIAGEENSGTKGLAAVVVTKEEADGRDAPISRTETTDPVETFLSRKGGSRSQAPTKEQQEQMKGAAESVAKALHLGNVRIITTPKADDPNSGLKAYYDKATGQIVIYAGNHVDNADIVQSVLHEGVAHYGLRQLLGDKFDTFLDEVYAAATPEIRKRVDHIRQRDGYSSQRDGTEEYLARLAETQNFDKTPLNFWNKVKFLFRNLLRGIGVNVNVTDNELRYILWRSHQNLTGARRSIFDIAADHAMQFNLHVGNNARNIVGGRPRIWGKHDMFSTAEKIARGADTTIIGRSKIEDNDETAREAYNKTAEAAFSQFREAHQDSMINVRNIQDAILKERGEELSEFENAYMLENLSHGRGQDLADYFRGSLYAPIVKALNDLAKASGVKIDDITDYMIAKHGLERNLVFAKRDAQYDYEEYKKEHPNGTLDLQYFFDKRRERDYSGLTQLTGADNVRDAEAEAMRIVEAMERGHEEAVHKLWNAVNAATKWTLKKSYDSGVISKDNYDEVSKMFKFYIPLRGWEQTKASDVYSYVGGDKGTAFSPTLKKARGRKTVADNPIAYIASMGISAISQWQRNMFKQAFLRFVENHPSTLVTVGNMWYVNHGTKEDPDWREDIPDIPENATADQIAKIVKDHEERMQQQKALGLATQVRGRLHVGLPVTKEQGKEHHVVVSRNGKQYILYINGNPRAAQALNGSRSRRASEYGFISAMEQISKQIGGMKNHFGNRAANFILNPLVRGVSNFFRLIGEGTRMIGPNLTSLNPAFIIGNAFRDVGTALNVTRTKESLPYINSFRITMLELGGPVRVFELKHWYEKYRAQGGDGNTEKGKRLSRFKRWYWEFNTSGARTGFTGLKDIEDYKRQLKKDLADAQRGSTNIIKIWHNIMDAVEYANSCVEDMTRFATFIASRKNGRSINQSATDAKNITLNFNRKGTGEMGGKAIRELFIFSNPAIQALEMQGSLLKHHAGRFFVNKAFQVLTGAGTPLLTMLLWQVFGSGDDDDEWNAVDEYFKLPTWQRRNNFVVWIPGANKFAMIPLAQEYRVDHGFGEAMASYRTGHNDGNVILETLNAASSLLPLDFTGNGGNPAITLTPTVAQPIMQVAFNADFTGRPIFKDNGYNKYEPAWQKSYVGTPSELVAISKKINGMTGGNEHRQGWVERSAIGSYANNPAVVDHILRGYLGGKYTIIAQLGGIVMNTFNDEATDVQELPIVNRVVTAPRETEQSGKVKLPDWYYSVKEDYDRNQNEFTQFRKDLEHSGGKDDAEINRIINSPEFVRSAQIGEYLRGIQQVRAALQYELPDDDKEELNNVLKQLLDSLNKLRQEDKKE